MKKESKKREIKVLRIPTTFNNFNINRNVTLLLHCQYLFVIIQSNQTPTYNAFFYV